MTDGDPLARLEAEIVECRRCPRLVAYREAVAAGPRASYAGERYWGRPMPGFGDPKARVLLLGLAPAAHGGNRTGRIFTGDRSGDFLFAALHRAGFASQPASVSRNDGQRLTDCFISAAVRCAPPANRPTPAERDNCLPWASAELAMLPRLRVVVCLGAFAWDAALRLHTSTGARPPRPRPRFGHGSEWAGERWALLGSYHPSQQNTFTGKLTPPMIDAVLARARSLADQTEVEDRASSPTRSII
jgi:uracil-DNA glycosylase family 4